VIVVADLRVDPPHVVVAVAEDGVGLGDLLVGREKGERLRAIVGEPRLLLECGGARRVPRLHLRERAGAVHLFEIEVGIRLRSSRDRWDRHCKKPGHEQRAREINHCHLFPSSARYRPLR